jgi:endonuclease YncB( thermonuclease family)
LARKKKTIYAMSRRRRNLIFAVVLLSAAILILLDRGALRRQVQLPPKSDIPVKANDIEKYQGKTFTVVNVVDGDTLDIKVPDGENSRTQIRLLGIDAPETRSQNPVVRAQGEKAAEFVKKLALGKRATVYLDKANETRGKYGRLLAYIKLADGTFLNETLLTEGYAYADLRFRHSLSYKYRGLEIPARSQKKGLWENPTREQLPEWLQERKPELLLKK